MRRGRKGIWSCSARQHRESSRCIAAYLMRGTNEVLTWARAKEIGDGVWGRGKELRRLRWFFLPPKKDSRGRLSLRVRWDFHQKNREGKPLPYRLDVYCVRILPQSPTATAPSRREPNETSSLRSGAPRPTLIIATSKLPLNDWCQLHGADGAVLIPLACTLAEESSPEGWGYRGKGTACSRFPSPIAG